MCCCGKPVINGQDGYRWNVPDGPTGIYPINAPDLIDGDVMLIDEPGRCGGLDSHHLHLRVVQHSASNYLLVRHGRGDERIQLSGPVVKYFLALDSNARYWMLGAIFHAHSDGERSAQDKERARWNKAAAEKRIKTRKQPGRSMVRVWIEPEVKEGATRLSA